MPSISDRWPPADPPVIPNRSGSTPYLPALWRTTRCGSPALPPSGAIETARLVGYDRQFSGWSIAKKPVPWVNRTNRLEGASTRRSTVVCGAVVTGSRCGATGMSAADVRNLDGTGISSVITNLLDYERIADDVDSKIGRPEYVGVTSAQGPFSPNTNIEHARQRLRQVAVTLVGDDDRRAGLGDEKVAAGDADLGAEVALPQPLARLVDDLADFGQAPRPAVARVMLDE